MQKVNQQNLKFTDQSQMSTSLYYAYSGRFRAASEDGESRVLLWNLDRHRLDLSVVLQAVFAQLTTVARQLVATERSRHVKHIIAVHPDSAGLDAVSEVDRSVEILGEHGGAEAVR